SFLVQNSVDKIGETLLQAPYETNCYDYSKIGFLSQSYCVAKCLALKCARSERNKLWPYDEFVLDSEDILLLPYNSSTVDVHRQQCIGECKYIDCFTEHYETVRSVLFKTDADFIMEVETASSHFPSYTHEPLETICEFIANVGGICGIYLGICMLDAIVFFVALSRNVCSLARKALDN